MRHGISRRGLALYGTVLSCPVRLCKALFAEASQGLVLYGGAESGPVGSSGVWFCKVWQCKLRRFMVRCSAHGWGTVERGFVWLGKVSLWYGEVLNGVAGFSGARYCLLRSYCGMALHREVLYRVVKFGPVMHSMVMHGKVLLRRGTVVSGLVRLCAVGHALVFFGSVLRGVVLSSSVVRAMVL